MTFSLIPESAPFNTEQRAWLNGFFAGLTGLQTGEAGAAAAVMEGQALTDESTTEADAEEELEEDPPWHDPGLPIDDRLAMAEERPLSGKLMSAMAQLDCGACGYICRTYALAIASGEESKLTLCVPGGKETSRTLKTILKDSGDAPAAGSNGQAKTTGDATDGYSRTNPFAAKVLCNRNLSGEGSAKQVTHVELDLTGSGLTYEVGDSLGVYPTNCTDLVADIIERLRATGEEQVTTSDGQTRTLRQALTSSCCLSEVTDELLDLLTKAHTNGSATAIVELQDDPDRLDAMDVLDLLTEFNTVTLSPADFVASLSDLAPRLYSISSSLHARPEQVHLTVGRVSWTEGERTKKGVCSTLLSDRVTASESTVDVFVQKSHGFGLPADGDQPIIMVGPGTGIAPFRAFLQERAAKGQTGQNWLFFGDQKRDCDFLYADEFAEYQESGLLTRLDLAFSRDQKEKVYVQHKMLEAADELWSWLEAGASFFVCGDAKRMAADVDAALHQIAQTAGGKSAEEAKAYIQQLKTDKRYLRDVY